MTLIGGPYNNRSIADSGTVVVSMFIYSDGVRIGSTAGIATYEPSANRALAFYLDSAWGGPIVAIVD